MNWIRVFGILALCGVTFAQDAAQLRFTSSLDSIAKYGGKIDFSLSRTFVFARDVADSSKVPAGLKTAFENTPVNTPGKSSIPASTTYQNISETVHDVLENGSRVVLVEETDQTTVAGQFGVAERTRIEMTRTHAPNGDVSLTEVLLDIQGGSFGGDDKFNQIFKDDYLMFLGANLREEQQILEGCYKGIVGSAVPLMSDIVKLVQFGDETLIDSKPAFARYGDVRLTRLPDGGVECRVSYDPRKYNPAVLEPNMTIKRYTLHFNPDGTLEHQDHVSSRVYLIVRVTPFWFEGSTYQVRYTDVFRTSGVLDRLR
jgi:hypothetical protein